MAKPNIVQSLKIHNDLRKEDVVKVLAYNPVTGLFVWKNRPDIRPCVNANFRGKIAGRPNTWGHIQITINGKIYVAHRLAWLVMTGKWPKELIDHKNNIPSDNRWKNIRQASKLQNGHNRATNANNKSRYKGVKIRKKGFQSAIQFNNKQIYLGSFATAKEAHAAYQKAATKLFGRFARFA